MAHNVQPMDIDNIESDFDNKENSIHHSNVYLRTPCTEKGYEELDVSELNMKLRYSITPASSPMSKSFTANCVDNRSLESGDDNINSNLTRSLHSAISKGDVINKSVKTLPLQTISSEQFADINRSASLHRPLDTSAVVDNVTITVTEGLDADEIMSYPSSSSSTAHTPEATTPTKEIPRGDGGSPIMRGLKSVLNMFRSSQSPIPPSDNADSARKQVLSPLDVTGITPESSLESAPSVVLASTPLAAIKHKESNLSKRSSPLKDSLVFNEDLEKELLWKDETTILFSQEKIPIHKLFFQQGTSNIKETAKNTEVEADLNSTVEYMDISFNDSVIKNKTITEVMHANESDAEFLDCETTFTNDANVTDCIDNNINNSNGTDPIDSNVKNESNKTSNITEIISTPNAENSSVNTESMKLAENMPEPKLQQLDVTPTLEKETTYTSQLKSEPERNNSKQEILLDIKNNTSDIKQEINQVITTVNAENNDKIIKTNMESESKTLLDATLDTLNLQAENYNVKELQSDIISSEPPVDMIYETTKIATDLEIITSSVNTFDETKLSEKSNNNHSNNLTDLNTEINAPLLKEIENNPLIFDTNNTDVKNEKKFKLLNETQVEILDSPANIPLPDDEDIENEKSVGAVLLVEEGSVPFRLNINTPSVTGLENIDQVDNMPIVQAKLIDRNNTIDDCLTIKDFVATNNENKTNQIEPLDGKIVCNDNISVQINSVQENMKSVEMLSVNEPMEINDSISDAQVMDVVLEKNMINVENMDQNLDITLEQVSDLKDVAIQLVSQTILQAQKDVSRTHISEINEAKLEDTKINVSITPHVHDSVDFSINKEDKQFTHEPETELLANITMNNTVSFDDEYKGPQEQQQNKNESHIFQNVLNETAVVSDVIQEKIFTDDAKNIESTVEVMETDIAKIEEISQKQLSFDNISEVKSAFSPLSPLLHQISSDLEHGSNTVNNENDSNAMPETTVNEENAFSKDQNVVEDVVMNVESKDEEIVLSENNSPYVSLTGQIDPASEHLNFKKMENSCPSKSRVVFTPPSSPKIVSKGYNFNFDEIDDPFATKTKIRMSPTPDTPNKSPNETDTTFTPRPPIRDVNKNRRKSQPERKKPGLPKKKMNSTFCGPVNVPEAEVKKQIPDAIKNQSDVIIDNKYIPTQPLQEDKDEELRLSSPINIDRTTETVLEEPTSKKMAKEETSLDVRDIDTTIEVNTEENKSSVESLNAVLNEATNASSSEHSTYYSASTSSGEGAVSRNVFNLPEIDDMNFNPFVSKSKMRQSPPPKLNATSILNASQELTSSSDATSKSKADATFTENPFETKSNMRQSPPPNLNATTTLNASQEVSCSSNVASKFKSDATFTESPFETKSKMRQSPPPNLNVTTTLNSTQELASSSDVALKFKSDATFTENPFETKSKMRQSPPLNLNATTTLNDTQELSCSSNITPKSKSDVTFTENPFETKSKMRQSPPPSLNATASLNATQQLSCASDIGTKFKSDASLREVYAGDFELNKDFSTLDDKEYANISNTTCSSKATDEKDVTVREVLTEDEDTIEGPFLEAEDLSNDDKMSDFDGEDVDMMQFSELPPQAVEENVEGGELFIDAEAFEFLLNQNKSNVVADSGKESLFLKFDPLFAKRMSSDGVLAALNKKRQSTPKKMSAAVHMDATFDKSIAGPSILNTTHEVATNSTANTTHEIATNSTAEESTDDFNVTVSKPMMVVTPAVNPIVTPRIRTATPPSSNRRSITFTSPAIAVIDRLLSLSANNSLVGHDTTVTHMSREQAEADLALTQLRELLAEKEINVYNLRTESKELKDRLSSMESQMRILESESQDRLKKINNLNEKLTEKTKLNKSMGAVVEEYERTIASLIAETEQDKKRNNEERVRLIKERDEQTAHLASMEVSFSDLHSKYEKSKQIILICKANEDAYKKSIKDFEENLAKMQSNYELLKQHATSKLNHANQELEKMNRSHESEVLKLNAMIKRKDLHITSLEETLAQKTKANEELTAICDELINKVG